MKYETLSTRKMLRDITSMRFFLSTFLDHGKNYEPILKYIIENDFVYNDYRPVSLKDISLEIGISNEAFRRQIQKLYEDLINDEFEQFHLNFNEIEYQISLMGYKNHASLTIKSLPIMPRIGESIQIPYFKEYVGEEHFYIRDIRHEFYNRKQVICIQVEGGHYNLFWHIHRDEAIEKGDINWIDSYIRGDSLTRKEMRKMRKM